MDLCNLEMDLLDLCISKGVQYDKLYIGTIYTYDFLTVMVGNETVEIHADNVTNGLYIIDENRKGQSEHRIYKRICERLKIEK